MTGGLPIRERGDGQWALVVHGSDVWCKDRGVLLLIRDALAEQGARGPRLPAAEADRVYFPGTEVAHLVDLAPPVPAIYCDPRVNARRLMGTGTQDEIDHAADLDLCAECARRTTGMRAVR